MAETPLASEPSARADSHPVIKIPAPHPRDLWIMRGLVLVGVIAWLSFVLWFFQTRHIGAVWLYWPLAIAIGFKLLRTLHEWYHYLAVSVPRRPVVTRQWRVDMFTTYVPGEPYEMVLDTLEAMVKVRYPHRTYLCDEGNDPYLRAACERLGVIHVYRGPDKTDAKAGNINYALQQATGEIAVILDPDHKPVPEFLDQVLPYFEEENVGYVQSVQAYYNRDESFISKGAAEQTYHFYGPMMMSMNSYGTVQAIGANCAFRRKALDSIGGHAAGLSEDMHTAMQLHARGWRSVYVPEALTRGQVPSTLSAYYQQQLKWTRGSLDLLFRTVPKLLRNFTWKQALHYLTLPLYFLFGIVALIDLSVPVLSLMTSEVPWLVEMDKLVIYVVPLLLMVLIIRQFAQRWLLEDHERGMHFLGGTLMLGTWWIFLVGFIYTVLNIKVPYIPTPKGNQIQNEWRLSIPNLAVMLLSLLAIWYGLGKDWSPYTLIMATFAGINVVMLGLVVLMGQQKLLRGFYLRLYGGTLDGLRVRWWQFRHLIVYRALRSISLAVGVIAVLLAGAIYQREFSQVDPQSLGPPPAALRQSEGHYLGVDIDVATPQVQVVRLSLPADPARWAELLPAWEQALQQQQLPLLTWDPARSEPGTLSSDLRYQAIASGRWDEQWEWLFGQIRRQEALAFLNVMPCPDRYRKGWSDHPANAPRYYLQAWDHIRQLARRKGMYQVVWFEEMFGNGWLDMYRGQDDYADVVFAISGASSLPGEPDFQTRLCTYARVHAHQPTWVLDFAASKEQGWAPVLAFADTSRSLQGIVLGEGDGRAAALEQLASEWARRPLPDYRSQMVGTGDPPRSGETTASRYEMVSQEAIVPAGELMVHGQPFYVRGVAYNPMHDWRDGFYPLSRPVLEADFEKIVELGANTIRRYHPGVYDRNLLSVAEEKGLKVLYGFWFDPKVDYATDHARVRRYKAEVLRKVQEFSDREAILAWGIGNETWGLLKHHVQPTYLPIVRAAYLQMIEDIVAEVKRLDPDRPVFAAVEHSADLPMALQAYHRLVPSLDWIGLNAYYEEHLAQVDSLVREHYPGKPYLISEFGPDGYWDEDLTRMDGHQQPLEPSAFTKAAAYLHHWRRHIEPHADRNLGGVAFCWRDRMQGTISWFGLTDRDGRLRPAYVALQQAWGQVDTFAFPLPDVYLPTPGAPFGTMYFHPIHAPMDNRDVLNLIWELREYQVLDQVELDIDEKKRAASVPVSELKQGRPYRVYVTLVDATGKYAVTASQPFIP